MAISLKPASDYSLQELTSLYNQARSDYLVPMQMTPDQFADHLRRYDIALDASCVAVDDANLPVGMGMLGLRDDRAWITRLGVMITHRRQGAGRAIVDWLVHTARSRGLRLVQLEVIIGNTTGYSLFERAGFRPVRELVVLQRAAEAPLQPYEKFVSNELFAPTCVKLLQNAIVGASWTEEARSIVQTRGLSGFSLPGGQGWLIYCTDDSHIEHIVIDPTVTRATARAMICHLHARHPGRVVTVENIPANSRLLPLYQTLLYTVAFRRTEMMLRLSQTSPLRVRPV